MFRSFTSQASIVSILINRRNDSVDVRRAPRNGHDLYAKTVVHDVGSDAKTSHRIRRKRPIRFAFIMNIPTRWFILSSWHRRRVCAVAVSE
jgi:hypothetical protein